MKKIYICAICNKTEEWNDNWAYRYLLDGNRNSYDCTEVPLVVCSDECIQKEKKLKKRDLIKLAYENQKNQRELNAARDHERSIKERKLYWHE